MESDNFISIKETEWSELDVKKNENERIQQTKTNNYYH